MDTIQVDILNPKSVQLLKNLADLNLIAICDNSKSGFATGIKNYVRKESRHQHLTNF